MLRATSGSWEEAFSYERGYPVVNLVTPTCPAVSKVLWSGDTTPCRMTGVTLHSGHPTRGCVPGLPYAGCPTVPPSHLTRSQLPSQFGTRRQSRPDYGLGLSPFSSKSLQNISRVSCLARTLTDGMSLRMPGRWAAFWAVPGTGHTTVV